MSLYRDADIKEFDTKLPEIAEAAELATLEKLKPTIKDMWEIIFIVRDFVIEKRRKIYGGFALNKLIESVAPEDKFYGDEDIKSWDIDFYSPDPVNDAKEICNRLYAKNFRYIHAFEAQHEETYKVFAETVDCADISYVPRNIYNKMPFKEIGGLHLTGPHFMMIDYFRVLRDPLGSYHRLEKTVVRLGLMDKHFPLPHNTSAIDIVPAESNLDIAFKTVHEFLTDRDSVMVLGIYAYNQYVLESGIQDRKNGKNKKGGGTDADNKLDRTLERGRNNKNRDRDRGDGDISSSNKETDIKMVPVNYYEVISTNYKKDASDLIIKLREKFADNGKLITYEESYPFFQYLGYSVAIKYEDEIICKMYHYNNTCLPYHIRPAYYFGDRTATMLKDADKSAKITIGSFPMLMLYNLINIMKARADNDQHTKNTHYTIVSHLIEMRKWYLTKENKTSFDDTIFKDFILECRGSMLTPKMEKAIRSEKTFKSGKKTFKYNPDNEKDRENKFVWRFKNTSGNPIRNESNRKIDLNLNEFYKETDVEKEIMENDDTADDDIDDEIEIDTDSTNTADKAE